MTPLGGPLWQIDETWYGNATDDNGVDWIVETEDGWSSGPSIRGDVADLPGGDGGFDSNPLFSARVISLTGVATGEASAVNAARLRFPSLTEAARGGVLTVTEDGLSLSAVVRPSGPFRADQFGSYSFKWSLQLTAPDPRKYGPALEQSTTMAASSGGLAFPLSFPLAFGTATGGSVAIGNDGTIKSWPVVRITGPVVNPRILNPTTGDEVRIALTLAAGEYLDIDTAARTVLLQGTASRRALVSTVGEWLPVPPGGASFTCSADTYDATALFTFAGRGAWI